MREYVTLECGECKSRNYRTSTQTRQQNRKRLELSKYCRLCRRHTKHVERRR